MTQIASILKEARKFPPNDQFKAKARLSSPEEYEKLYRESIEHPEAFWGRMARENLRWEKPFTSVLDWNPPFAKWYEDGKINACTNCIDRHLESQPNKPAIIWEGEPGERRTLTYLELSKEINKLCNGLLELGLKAGDRVTIYMPMVPEMAIAVLACARLGLTHSVVFAGFSAEALAERNTDAAARLVITADGAYRRGKTLALKAVVDASLKSSPTVEKVLVLQRTGEPVSMVSGRDVWWHDLLAGKSEECPPASLDAEHPLFLLYTSGSTGKPKGILHTTGGYLMGAHLSFKYVFDIRDDDVFWCSADVGWITGHSNIVYGPLSNGATVVMYEGAPDYPQPDRFWQIIEKHKVSIFYTAPTAIRAFMKWGDSWLKPYDLSSVRLLGTVGEPINPKAWMWFRKHVGGDRCPIVDTWWQTETGSIMIAPLPGITETTPGTATKPFFGILPEVVDDKGKPVPRGSGGYLIIRQPWPSMLRTIFGDDERYKRQYWSTVGGAYFTGDGARQDEDGNFWIMGRIDDVINVSGHRLSTMEIESALVSHPRVAEAAVVGIPDELKGEAIACFVTLEKQDPSQGDAPTDEAELKQHVVNQIGALARPERITITDGLPKTRSGKIMRRLLRDVAAGKEASGDLSTLENRAAIDQLIRNH